MEFLKKHATAILYVVITLFLVFFGYRLYGKSAKVSDILLFGFFCSALLVVPILELGEKILKQLRDMEPKMGSAPGSSNSLAIEQEHSHSLRSELELALIHSIGRDLVVRMEGQDLGAYIRAVADAIYGSVQVSAKTACTCGPGDACSNCPSPSALPELSPVADPLVRSAGFKMNCSVPGCNCVKVFGDGAQTAGAQADQAAEAEIVAAGLTAPRVTAEQIQALMDKLTWRYEQPEGTTSTFAHAFLGRFYLATGHSGCVSPENFNAALGQKYAREQAEGKARDKLWELEGWFLHRSLTAGA